MSKYIKLEDAISKIVNTPTRVITDDLTALADRQHEIIDMLSDLPTIEVSEDAISREDAVNALIAHFIPQTYTGEQVEQASKLARKIMANAPSVIPKAKEGEWKITINQDYRCSNCNKITSSYKANYCPNWGSKMKGADE